MYLGGIQKLTLLDYPGKLACTVFTTGCNYRCPFCHNAALVTHPSEQVSVDDVLEFLKKRRGVLQGVCVSGGEPLLQPDTPELLAQIRNLGYSVKLDTNGSFPERLRQVVEAGLVDYVAMDVKNSPAAYGETVGREDFDLSGVSESIRYLLSGAVDYEFRTTVVREFHDAQRLTALAQWISGAKRYYLQAFEDSGDLIAEGLHGYDREELEQLRDAVAKVLPCVELRGV